jgi:hypothetical protein
MDNNFSVFLPDIILLLLFVFFLWRRHSLRAFNWLTLACIALSLVLLAVVIWQVLDKQADQAVWLRALLIALPVIVYAFFLLFLTQVLTVEKMQSKFHFDERITTANAKSARNALIAVYFLSVIDLLIYSSFSRVMLLGILVASLVVYLVSMVIYYYRSF